jgi:molybdopterin converting factor small subunit
MPRIHFTYALKRFYPDLKELEIQAGSVADVLWEVEKQYPGIRDYIVEENGALRKHVNIFLAGRRIKDTEALTDPVRENDEIHIMQALSGG